MKITCRALEPGGAMRSVDEPTALEGWRSGAGAYWIHLDGVAPESFITWLAGLGLAPGLLDLLKAEAGETCILPLDRTVFVAYPLPGDEPSSKPNHFYLLCLDRLVVTMHAAPVGSTGIDELKGLILPEGTTAGVVCALAQVQCSRLRRHAVAFRGSGDMLADRMDSDPRSVSAQEILALKREALSLGRVVDEELAVLEALKVSNQPALPMHRLASTLQSAIEIARATDRDVDRLGRRMGDLQLRYELAQRELTNRRLGFLAVLSAIFMPLTLITGIYGMNFDLMPELHYRYSYPIALGTMALIAAGLFWYFRSRWWPK